MKIYLQNFMAGALLVTGLFVTQVAHAQVNRNIAKYNLNENQPALKGYDPVSYFAEGGGVPQKGEVCFRVDHLGVTYLFASQEHADLFQKNPEKYEPTYGGWCAYAMARDSRVDIDPLQFTISGNRAHFFVSGRAKRSFDLDIAGEELLADGFWKAFSGEEPRK